MTVDARTNARTKVLMHRAPKIDRSQPDDAIGSWNSSPDVPAPTAAPATVIAPAAVPTVPMSPTKKERAEEMKELTRVKSEERRGHALESIENL